jgi:hypothetical protein
VASARQAPCPKSTLRTRLGGARRAFVFVSFECWANPNSDDRIMRTNTNVPPDETSAKLECNPCGHVARDERGTYCAYDRRGELIGTYDTSIEAGIAIARRAAFERTPPRGTA